MIQIYFDHRTVVILSFPLHQFRLSSSAMELEYQECSTFQFFSLLLAMPYTYIHVCMHVNVHTYLPTYAEGIPDIITVIVP